jgi:hypothetical protein
VSVTGHDELPDRDTDLIRAAEAAASWVRARRATWTRAPASNVATAPPVEAREEIPELDAPEASPEFTFAATQTSVAPTPARKHIEVSNDVSVAARIAASVRAVPAPVVRGVALAALVLALGTAAFQGARYVWRSWSSSTTTTTATKAPAVEPAPGRVPAAARKATGSVRVTSTPAGARVLVDGKARGVTPLTLGDLSPGNHEVALESNAGTVRRTVAVAANQTAQVEESIFSGWLAVYAPFEVVIAEANRVLRPDERGQILLPPGLHNLRVANRTLGYEATWSLEIKPGETTNLRVTPGPSALTVTSPEAAEVWVDGAKVGETPLNAAPVPLGTHDVLVKRASGTERRYTITVGVKPFTLNADFR